MNVYTIGRPELGSSVKIEIALHYGTTKVAICIQILTSVFLLQFHWSIDIKVIIFGVSIEKFSSFQMGL